MTTALTRSMAGLVAWRPSLQPLTLAFLASVYFTLACNDRFLAAIYASVPADSLLLAAMTALAITAFHFILFALFMNRWTVKPVLVLLIVLTAATVYFARKYGVYLDVAMLRNVIATDPAEVRDLLAWDMLPHTFAYIALPLLLLWRVRMTTVPLRRSLVLRAMAIFAALVVAGGALAAVSRDLVPLMREQKELRHLITPANYIYGLARIAGASGSQAAQARQVIGADATHHGIAAKPTLLLLVIGETARAANWGLSGYARQTTPELATLDVFNFPDVGSCGTNTETSLPCMFSPLGRRHYADEGNHNSESLLHVLTHAGLRVAWRDNQSGCKGVCEGLPVDVLDTAAVPGLCEGNHCLDEVLLQGLAAEIAANPGDQVIVLHQIGNHGPAYYQRYPDAFRRFAPACNTAELGQCTRDEIINAYDNAVLYTDHVLAQAIALLKTLSPGYDTALLYVSDHGESLGENGLYLHSLPPSIAPDTQTHVPMVLWLSADYTAAERVDADCLRRRSAAPASHDNLFHTVLGIMDVESTVYDGAQDLLAPCRSRR